KGSGGKGPKREKESSHGSKDSNGRKLADSKQHKKSKHHGSNRNVHFSDEKKKAAALAACHLSPYGCHMNPDKTNFPQPNLDSLPTDPLSKGEQYYVDLAGNIRKGPVGMSTKCFCVPFFKNVEKKMESDKRELIDHID